MRRPPLVELGLNRVARTLLLIELVLLLLSGILYPVLGLSFVWHSAWGVIALPTAVFLLWIYLAYSPGRSPWDWAVAERMLALGIFCLVSLIQPQLQYVALAFKRPLIDAWLVAADSFMGVHLVQWTAWSRGHALLLRVLVLAYVSFGTQLCLPLFGLGIRGAKDRAALWEYLFHLVVCITVTIVLFGFFPSASSGAVYGFQPVVVQDHVARQIVEVRNGQLTRIELNDLEGLISFPSFHVAGALIIIWTFRHKRWAFRALVGLNICLVAATLLLGIHYAIDLIGGGLVFLASLWLYERMGFAALMRTRTYHRD